jgi:hypothetical protein
VDIVETVPAAEQDGPLAALVWARKHNQAPFIPPEKRIFPWGTSEVGLAVSVIARLVLDNAIIGASTTFVAMLAVSPLEVQ